MCVVYRVMEKAWESDPKGITTNRFCCTSISSLVTLSMQQMKCVLNYQKVVGKFSIN